VLMLTFPTLAYEYNLPSLLGFIPLLIYWSTLIDNPIKEPMPRILNFSFLAFILVASFSNIINQGIIIMSEYLVISAFFFVVPLFYYWNYTRGSIRANKAQIQ
ncbi:MAG: hypothetical protein ACXWNC_03375, partial [Anaerolineales bacterium]